MVRNNRAGPRIALIVACAVLLAISISPLVDIARADLPPRPNPPAPTGSNGGKSPAGAPIALRATFSPGWPWDRVHWQELWTVVEWQSAEGAWYAVAGWQGTLDRIMVEENGDIVGEKEWWVYEPNLGQGPFRWLVYAERDGRPIAASDPFHLPGFVNQRSAVEVSLTR
ncbi:MAG: hypothetical protein JXA14_14940 [Anaerolineae bacterium]|nr:hypothetical protein [Anaerolineae bacterium]